MIGHIQLIKPLSISPRDLFLLELVLVLLQLPGNLGDIFNLLTVSDPLVHCVPLLGQSEAKLLFALLLDLPAHAFNHRDLILQLLNHVENFGIARVILINFFKMLQIPDIHLILLKDLLHIFCQHTIVDNVVDISYL
jgi:hypothetical protein